MDFLQTIIGMLIGGGLIGFIQWMIQRSDSKKEKESKILKAINDLSAKITIIEGRMEKSSADGARRRILTFDDELRRGLKHSEESFNQILSDVHFYRNFCKSHEDYENDKAVSAIEHIRVTYQKVKAEDKFI